MEDLARNKKLYVIAANDIDPGTSFMDSSPTEPLARPTPSSAFIPAQNNTFKLALAALGVVYGDIGTSPLYAVRECFIGCAGQAVNRRFGRKSAERESP